MVASAFCVLIIYPLIQDFNTEVQDLGGGKRGGGGGASKQIPDV